VVWWKGAVVNMKPEENRRFEKREAEGMQSRDSGQGSSDGLPQGILRGSADGGRRNREQGA